MNFHFANLLFILIAIVSLGFGIFIYCRPLEIFEIQRKFYAIINWRIEPISLEKEVRNTKVMGLFLVVFVVLASVYAWRQ